MNLKNFFKSENVQKEKSIDNGSIQSGEYYSFQLAINILFLFFSRLWCDFWFRIFVYRSLSLSGIFYNFLFTVSFVFLLLFLLSFIKEKWQNAIAIIITLISLVFYGAQFIYHAFFQKLFTWFSVLKGGKVVEFGDLIIQKILTHLPGLFILCMPLLLFIFQKKIMQHLTQKSLWQKKKMIQRLKHGSSRFQRKLFRIKSLTISLLLFVMTLFFMFIGSHDVNSPYHLYFIDHDPLIASEKYGLLPAMSVDLRRLMFPSLANLGEINHPFIDKYLIAVMHKNNQEATLKQAEYAASQKTLEQKKEIAEKNQLNEQENVFPIDFSALMKNETDPFLMEMHQYFQQKEPTRENDHTGMFEGYNLIFITAESFCTYAVDQEITPTLYEMQEKGMKFTNFYNPIWDTSTTDGEYTGLMGMLPKPGVWSMFETADKYLPFAPGNMFKSLGYSTSAYHDGDFEYYARNITHPHLGYEEFIAVGNGLEDMVAPGESPFSDLYMLKGTLEHATAKEPFHAYYMSFSGHMPYDNTNSFYLANADQVEHLNLSEGPKAYLGAQYEFEKAMAYLLQYLRDKGIADRTLIVINGDHYPYALSKEQYDELAGFEMEEHFETYKNSLLIYCDGMKPEIIDKPCITIDIIPTLYNLLNIPYDSRLFAGQDIFSDQEPLIVFGDQSWITDKGKYNALTGEFIPEENVSLLDQDAYINEKQLSVRKKIDFSTGILDYDYYNLVIDKAMLQDMIDASYYQKGWHERFLNKK